MPHIVKAPDLAMTVRLVRGSDAAVPAGSTSTQPALGAGRQSTADGLRRVIQRTPDLGMRLRMRRAPAVPVVASAPAVGEPIRLLYRDGVFGVAGVDDSQLVTGPIVLGNGYIACTLGAVDSLAIAKTSADAIGIRHDPTGSGDYGVFDWLYSDWGNEVLFLGSGADLAGVEWGGTGPAAGGTGWQWWESYYGGSGAGYPVQWWQVDDLYVVGLRVVGDHEAAVMVEYLLDDGGEVLQQRISVAFGGDRENVVIGRGIDPDPGSEGYGCSTVSLNDEGWGGIQAPVVVGQIAPAYCGAGPPQYAPLILHAPDRGIESASGICQLWSWHRFVDVLDGADDYAGSAMTCDCSIDLAWRIPAVAAGEVVRIDLGYASSSSADPFAGTSWLYP